MSGPGRVRRACSGPADAGYTVAGVAEIDRLVRRSAELKQELLAFSRGRRCERALSQALARRFGSVVVAEEEELINFFDHFLLQHRLSDGRTVVERFVRARGDLPRAERDMLLRWRDVVEGIFEVERIEGDVLVAVNLIDDLTYRIRTNMGPALYERTPPGHFLIARVVPILDDWLLSGSLATFPPEHAEQLCEVAAKTALEHPHLVFRNPQRLELAWQQQRDDRARFIEFFGSDLIVFPCAEWATRMNEYWRHRSDGAAAPPQMNGASLSWAQTVGVIYDEVEGLTYLADFGPFQQAFEDPELLTQRRYREVVHTYLDDDSVSPLPFRRLAQANPDHASRVFARLLGKPSFTWADDGETLLRSAKAAYFAQPPTPRITPLSDRLAATFQPRTDTSPDRSPTAQIAGSEQIARSASGDR